MARLQDNQGRWSDRREKERQQRKEAAKTKVKQAGEKEAGQDRKDEEVLSEKLKKDTRKRGKSMARRQGNKTKKGVEVETDLNRQREV